MTESYGTFSTRALAYSSFRLIEKFKQINGDLPSGLYFNKGLSFINAETKKKGESIKLPHCWYRWGDEVVRYFMPRELIWSHEEASYTTVEWQGSPATLHDDKLKLDIDNLVNIFVQSYPRNDNQTLELLLADHYDSAPFEFQRLYKTGRDVLFDRTRSVNKREDFGSKILLPIFQRAFSHFPGDRLFQPVAGFIPVFMELVRYVSSGPSPDLDTLNEISEEFWYWFCYFLRIHPLAHENVSDDTLAFWRSELEVETDRFYRNFNDHVLALSSIHTDILHNDILLPYLNNGQERAKSFEESLVGLDDTMEGLNEFLAQMGHLKKQKNA